MARLGTLEYPSISLTEAVSIAEKVAKEFHGSITTSGLAKALQMAEKGGGFRHKVAAVKDYGLLDGRGTLSTTPLAERIVYPRSEREGDQARAESFFRVDLFKRLFDRTQGTIPDEESFAIFLEDVTGAGRIDVSKRSGRVRRLYAEGVQYARVTTPGDRPEDVHEESERDRDIVKRINKKERSPDFITLFAGDYELRLPFTPQSVDIIIGVLEMMKGQLVEGGSDHQTEPD